MKILDCNLFYGASINGEPYRGCDTFEELEAEAQRCGIDGGLVRCIYSNAAGVEYGNRCVRNEIQMRRESGWYGVWAALPPYTNETPKPENLHKEMKENKIGAIYIDPVSHRYILDPLSLGEVFAAAQEKKIPVILSTCCGVPMEKIYKIMKDFPHLTAIINDGDCWPNGRKIYPLLSNYKNIYLDLSYVMDAGGVEDMVSRFGAGKLLFGTGFPSRYTGSMLSVVRSAQISESEKEMIFGKNLENLLREADLW